MRHARTARNTSAVVTLVDAHSAIIDRCADGTLTRIHSIRASRPHGVSDHMGDAPRQSSHPGTRGERPADAAQRARSTERHRFIGEVAPVVAASAPADEWIVIGGNRLLAAALQVALARSHGRTAIVVDGLHRGLHADSIVARVTAAADAHLAAQDLADVRTLLERTGAHTAGVVGPIATLDAAELGAAEVVLMSRRYLEQHADDVAQLVAAAAARGGRVEIVADEAARLLDARAAGVGALLRFALHKMPAGVR